MAIHKFLDNEGLSEYNSMTHLLNVKNVPTEGEVNLINDSLIYSEQFARQTIGRVFSHIHWILDFKYILLLLLLTFTHVKEN